MIYKESSGALGVIKSSFRNLGKAATSFGSGANKSLWAASGKSWSTGKNISGAALSKTKASGGKLMGEGVGALSNSKAALGILGGGGLIGGAALNKSNNRRYY